MTKKLPREKIKEFLRYNFDESGKPPKFHDNDLRSIKILPSKDKTNSTNVEFVFIARWKPVSKSIKRVLTLKGCVNLRFSIDFDILAANASSSKSSAGQTSNVEMNESLDCISRLVKANEPEWNVEYPANEDNPATYKLQRNGEFLLVKVLLHGGTLEIVARDFEISDRRLS
jgi:hypothetical protein